MTIYTAPLTIRCRCGFHIEQQETEFARKPHGDIIADTSLPTLPHEFRNGKTRSVLEIGTWMFDSKLHYLDCPKCGLALDCCPNCNTFNDFEPIDPDGSGTRENMRCRICKKP